MAIKVEGPKYKGPDGKTKSAPPGMVSVLKDGVRLFRPADNPTPETRSSPVTSGQSTGDPQLDELARTMEGQLRSTIQGGNVLNTAITISPEKIKEFTDQALREVDPYYKGQFESYRKEFDQVVTESLAEFQAGEKAVTREFGEGLRTKREELAERGLAFSGVRRREEGELATGFQARLEQARRGILSAARTGIRSLERTVGTRQLGGLPIPQLRSLDIGGTFQPGESRIGGTFGVSAQPLFDLSPDVTGRLEEERIRALRLREEELKSAFREQEARRIFAGG